MKLPNLFLRLSRLHRRLLAILASLVLAYAALGFWVAPAVIKGKLPAQAEQLLGRKVTIQKVRVNPFALSTTLEGFRIQDRDGEAFLAWDRLYVNLGISTLFTKTITLQAVELDRPSGRVVIEKGGQLNFADILERLKKNQEPQQKPESTPREIAIGHLAIREARIQMLDRSLEEPFATTLGPLSLELKGFHTEPNRQNPYAFSGRTESGETFSWTGVFSTEPLASQGTVTLERLVLPKYHPYYKDQVAFDLKGGLLSAKATYAFQWSSGVHLLKVLDGQLDLQDLQLAETGQKNNAIELPKLELRGLQADLIGRHAELGSLVARDAKLDLVRLKNGQLSLVNLLTPKPRPKPAEPEKPFELVVRELGVKNFRVAFQDQSTLRPVAVLAENLDISLNDFSLDPNATTKLAASLTLDGQTRLQVEGTIKALKPSVELALKIEGLELATFDPYTAPTADLRVNRGRLSMNGTLRGAWEGKASDTTAFKGNVRLADFEVMDAAQQEPFLRYKDLRITGLNVSTHPEVLNIQSVELIDCEHRLVVAKDGSTNVARAFKIEPTPPPSPAGAVLGGAVPPSAESPFKVALAKMILKAGRLTYIDRSVEPNATFLITDLEGLNTGLSTLPESGSALTLTGKAGGLAPLSIQGHSMPLRRDQDTDVTVRIQGADLADFSPYTGKFLGYTVRKGKLDVDAHIKIEQRKLKALVKTNLDQFYLGDKVQSPDATHLPVKLALALLRDRKGMITVELPIEGSLDDPDFHYGKIVWKALFNLIAKIGTSPFTLIGSLFGGGNEDLSLITFAPGSAEPDAAAKVKFEVLIKSLVERPELNLEVEGTADPAADGAAFKKAGLENLLRRAKVQSLRAKNPDLDADAVHLTPEDRPHWLTAAFETAFPTPKDAKAVTPLPSPTPGEMEQRLLGTVTIDPNQLRDLADRRTKAVVKALLDSGKVEVRRVFEVEGGERAKKEGGSRVFFELK
ncbi:MAG: DUF748 domain-containing protein [Holophaga sp.]|nr:DUF748 domain-containing protein [Holophaga sp.]